MEHLFRQQAGRLVARLTRLMGPAYWDLAEDATQQALLRALQVWPYRGEPENPAAWLFRAAHNYAIDELRRRRLVDVCASGILADLESSAILPPDPEAYGEFADDELRMILLCCHPAIPEPARVALSLKTVGGLSVREIARAFLEEEATVGQRLVRAKRQIRNLGLDLELPALEEQAVRLDSVLEVIYFIFTAGYAAAEGADLVRRELCNEAIRLGLLVAKSSLSQPKSHALVALMAFQAARLPSRVDASGDLILLEDQDRSLWDPRLINLAFQEFLLCSEGNVVTPYHIQAAIAAHYAKSPDNASISWLEILDLYDQLLLIQPSGVVALNRAVAMAKVYGAVDALASLESFTGDGRLAGFYLWHAVRGHLYLELKQWDAARECFLAAIDCRCSEPEIRFLRGKLSQCDP